MKVISLSALLVALSCPIFAQERGIKFELVSSWKQLLDEAKRENMFVFVDCYASWCGPCKIMDQKIYPNEKVGDFFNTHFICVKLQMDTSAKDGVEVKNRYRDAQVIKRQFRVAAFPTFLFSPDGKVVHRGLGLLDTARIIELGEDALTSDRQYYTLLSKYEHGELGGAKELMGLAWSAKGFGDDSLAHRIANDYINSLRHNELMTAGNLEFMYYFTNTSKDRGFALCKDSAELIAAVFPGMSVEVSHGVAMRVIYEEVIKPFEGTNGAMPEWEKIRANLRPYGTFGEECFQRYRPRILFRAVIKPAMEKDTDWMATLKLIQQQGLEEGEEYLVGPAVIFYERQLAHGAMTDCRNLIEASRFYVEHYPDVAKAPQRNEFAYAVFQHDTNNEDLRIALGWAKYAVDSADSADVSKADYVDTYSNLLYKLGKKNEAILWEERAIEARPQDRGFQVALRKMQTGQPTW